MELARITGVFGYCFPVVAGIIGLSRGGITEIEMYSAVSGYLTGYSNPFFPLVALSLACIAIAWWDLRGKSRVFRATGLIVFVAFLLYAFIFAFLPSHVYSISSSLGYATFSEIQGAIFWIVLIPGLVQAGAMFLTPKFLRQPWFVPAGAALLTASILGPLYLAYPNSYASILGPRVFSNAPELQIVLLVVVAVFASFSFITLTADPSPKATATLDSAASS